MCYLGNLNPKERMMEMVYEVMDYAKNQDWGQILWWSKGGIITIAATIYLVSCLQKLRKKNSVTVARNELYYRLLNLLKEGNWVKYGCNSIKREFDSTQINGESTSKKTQTICSVSYGDDWDVYVNSNSVKNNLTKAQRFKICRIAKQKGKVLDDQHNALQTALIVSQLPGTTSV